MDNNLPSKLNSSVGNALKDNIKFKSSANKLEELKDVTKQFEAIFVYQLLKQARQGELSEGLFSSQSEDTFNSMIDQEYSEILSQKTNFGVSEALFEQFKSHVIGERMK